MPLALVGSVRSVLPGNRVGNGRGHPAWTLVAIAFGVIMVGVDATVVAVANPYIARSLHGSLSDLQWITNAYLLVLAVALIPMGMRNSSGFPPSACATIE